MAPLSTNARQGVGPCPHGGPNRHAEVVLRGLPPPRRGHSWATRVGYGSGIPGGLRDAPGPRRPLPFRGREIFARLSAEGGPQSGAAQRHQILDAGSGCEAVSLDLVSEGPFAARKQQGLTRKEKPPPLGERQGEGRGRREAEQGRRMTEGSLRLYMGPAPRLAFMSRVCWCKSRSPRAPPRRKSCAAFAESPVCAAFCRCGRSAAPGAGGKRAGAKAGPERPHRCSSRRRACMGPARGRCGTYAKRRASVQEAASQGRGA